MDRKRLVRPMIVFGIVLLLLTSCATPTPTTTGFPTGTFVNAQKDTGFQFNEDGTFDYFFGDLEEPLLVGTYSIDGNLFTEETINYPPCPYPGTYEWTYDGQNLTFQLFGEDECDVRIDAYVQTFIKSE